MLTKKELAIMILSGDILGTTEQTHEAVKMAVEALLERKTGRWIIACWDSVTGWNKGNGACSECKTYQFGICDDEHWQNYCGHCGAKMEVIE